MGNSQVQNQLMEFYFPLKIHYRLFTTTVTTAISLKEKAKISLMRTENTAGSKEGIWEDERARKCKVLRCVN